MDVAQFKHAAIEKAEGIITMTAQAIAEGRSYGRQSA
jgi:hypothetical protein